ncbi:C40 family peptidase [Streptosporangium sp. NPDC006007]|uniref:C40 family peptidase n=1 Tax=Streptosporangium sp. NPDC006007 TaxID=3154575 RepID=UPI0033B31186
MHSLEVGPGRATALVTGLACCLVMTIGVPADARPRHNGPSADEVAEARSKAVERSKQLGVVTALLAKARTRLEELTVRAGEAGKRVEGLGAGSGAAENLPGPSGKASDRTGGALTGLEGAEPSQSVVSGRLDEGRETPAGPQAQAVSHDNPGAAVPPDGPGVAVAPQDNQAAAVQVVAAGTTAAAAATTEAVARAAAEQAAAAVTRQAAEVRRLIGERARLLVETEAARSAADRLVERRQTAQEKSRVARDRARYGRYRAAAMARLRARAVVARKDTAPTWALNKSSGSAPGDIAADWALTQIDKPYLWAGAGPRSYDCSGLTMQAWARVGVKMGHWTGTQWTSGRHVRLNRLRRGDLLFFGRRTRNHTGIRHVGIYIGRGLMVHAPRTGDVVRVAPMWRRDLIGATRPA